MIERKHGAKTLLQTVKILLYDVTYKVEKFEFAARHKSPPNFVNELISGVSVQRLSKESDSPILAIITSRHVVFANYI